MGRIRGKFIKNLSKKLVEQYPDKFSNKFEDNKKALDELKIIDDKPIRNKIAGYIVTVVEKKKIK
jgi:small subunit ribosomal protein S17e